ncbi:MAG: glycoside hydrolase family 1 protein [Candidatus Omnitrophica bacterium]|nr:glycoside hydrolase family 1 protein [Candidatus Omnitrophota bacterium]MDD5670820.1 glycoside hydrolase family 1 protein [Candidatus Omnitrophota bacterium]
MTEKYESPFSSFLWGTATSAHQIEGNNRFNDWWEWEQSGRLKHASGVACDHYRLFRQDIELISKLGHNAYRFSVEWSRIEPEENIWNEVALAYYGDILRELKSRHIEPIVTLHHFTNPVWFMRKGGWLLPDAPALFARFVKKVVSVLGKDVRLWITINEPMIYLYFSYLLGDWPPGNHSFKDSIIVFKNLVRAHVHAYQVIHQIYESALQTQVWVSIAQHMTHMMPCRPNSIRDRLVVTLRRWFVNFLFLEAVQNGMLFFPGLFCEALPRKKSLDFIGINYYSRQFVRSKGWIGADMLGDMCSQDHHGKDICECNSLGWEIYPEGLYQVLKSLRKLKLPVLIAENGICTTDDEQRTRFIRDHVAAVHRAIRESVQVWGYLYWSLVDNFEWDKGFAPRFGIVEVDYQTQTRKVKSSAQELERSCRKLCHGNENHAG